MPAVVSGPAFAADHLGSWRTRRCANPASLSRFWLDVYCGSFRGVPKLIVLDVDNTFGGAHGGQ
jgi:hypothetical protein